MLLITRVELDGFKTFDKFIVELGPFQVIVGANGAGKSNLFDALRLLSLLVDTDLRSAFSALRGEAGELFTLAPDSTARDEMRLAVELLVDRKVEDSWGATADITHTRLRYEVHVARRPDDYGLERLYVTYESLEPILRSQDEWFKRHVGPNDSLWRQPLKSGRSVAFITTNKLGDFTSISLHQDGHGGRIASRADRIERTVLSGVTNTEHPHAFAAREELGAWTFLHLNPEVLREPSPMLAHPTIAADGSHLANALARMRQEDPLLLNDVARDLANLVPEIVAIGVDDDPLPVQRALATRTRRRRHFDIGSIYEPLAQLIQLDLLEELSAYRHFQHDLRQMLVGARLMEPSST